MNSPYRSHQTVRKENSGVAAQMNMLPTGFHPQCLFGTEAEEVVVVKIRLSIPIYLLESAWVREEVAHTQTLAELGQEAQVEGLVAQVHTWMQAELVLEEVGLGY